MSKTGITCKLLECHIFLPAPTLYLLSWLEPSCLSGFKKFATKGLLIGKVVEEELG
jgi:hypothetical protein